MAIIHYRPLRYKSIHDTALGARGIARNNMKMFYTHARALYVCLAAWLVGWLVGWLAGWLAGWLVSWLVVSLAP